MTTCGRPVVLFVCALDFEAQPIVQHLKLKQHRSGVFRSFKGEYKGAELYLVLSGVGILNASTAVASACAEFHPDYIVNLGVAGVNEASGVAVGTSFLVNKLTLDADGRSYYPDVTFKHSLSESALRTSASPVRYFQTRQPPLLFDMEGAAIAHVAEKFLSPSAYTCLKVVSDIVPSCEKEDRQILWLKKEEVFKLIQQLMPELESILGFLDSFFLPGSLYSEELKGAVQKLGKELRFTATQRADFNVLARGFVLRGGDLNSLLEEFAGLRCENKREVAEVFSHVKKLLSERKTELYYE